MTGAGGSRLLIASLAVAVFMVRLDIYIVAICLPSVARQFQAGAGAVSWVTEGYLLFSCGAMMLVGRIAAEASPRRLFLIGYAVFTAGALLCGVAPSLGLLVLFRCIQGLGGAIMVIMTYAAVSRLLPGARMGGVMGILATFGALGVAVGSPLGGLLTATLSWRWVFFVNVPVGLAAMVVAWRALPSGAACEQQARPPADKGEHARPGVRDECARQSARDERSHAGAARLDYAGGALSFLTVAAFVVMLDQAQQRGWSAPQTAGMAAGAVVCGALFVWREGRAGEPLIAPALLKDRRFQLVAATCVFGLILMGGNALVMPFYLELTKGLSTALAGLVLLSYSVAFMAVSPLAGRLADRFAPWRLCAAGMGLASLACVACAFTAGSSGLVVVVVFLLALAVVYGLFMPANSKQLLQAPPVAYRAAAPAVLGTLNSLSLLLGAAVFETLYAGAGRLPGGASVATHAIDTAAAATTGASAAGGPATDTAAIWWVPGVSPAYLAGAAACAVAFILCLIVSRLETPDTLRR